VLLARGGDADVQRRTHPAPRDGGPAARQCPRDLGAIGILRRLLATLRVAFPYATLRVRLDGGFATPALFAFLDAEGVEYLVAMASNVKLEKRIRRLLGRARVHSKATGQSAQVFGETRYAAKSWKRKRRVIMKAEVVRLAGRAPRDNPRFVVTNLAQSPRRVYEIYRERGDTENRLKELHYGLGFDRTSCSRFWANAVRVLLTAAAYVLLQALRARLAATPAASYQVSTLRERLFKLGTRVQVSARRIVLHLPSAFPGSPSGRPWLSRSGRVRLALRGSPPPLMFGRIRVTHAPLFRSGKLGLPAFRLQQVPLGATLEIQLSMDAILTVSNAIARSFTNSAG